MSKNFIGKILVGFGEQMFVGLGKVCDGAAHVCKKFGPSSETVEKIEGYGGPASIVVGLTAMALAEPPKKNKKCVTTSGSCKVESAKPSLDEKTKGKDRS